MLLIDEIFGVVIMLYVKGEKINDWWLYGLNIIVYLFWIVFCVIGVIFGEYILNFDVFGLDFVIIVMFIFLCIF